MNQCNPLVAAMRCIIAATASLAYSLTNATDYYLTEEDIVSELPTVMGAARMPQTIAATPAAVTIIDRTLIDASGAKDWIDLFRLVPGFQSYSVNGNRYGIAYHGIGREFPNHLEVMVNGRSVYQPLFSSVDWRTGLGISLSDVDHVEIIRGTNAPSFGSNAFLGAINIITRNPVQDQGVAIESWYGSRDSRNFNTRVNGKLADMDYRFSLGYQHNSGFPAVSDGPMDDGLELFQSSFRGSYTPNVQDSFDLELGFTRNRFGFGDPDHPDEYNPARFDNFFQSLKWQRILNSGNELQLHLYHNGFEGENTVPLGDLSELLAAEVGIDIPTAQAILSAMGISDGPFEMGFRDIKSRRIDAELQHNWQISDSMRASWGTGLRRESISAEALLEPESSVDMTSYRLFSNIEWQPHAHWVIHGGIMYEYNPIVESIASPRVAVNYLLNSSHSLRLSVARGNRSPSLLEANENNVDVRDGVLLNAVRRADSSLDAEKLDSVELGWFGSFPHKGLTVDLRIYHEKIRDGLEQYQQPIVSAFNDSRIAITDNLFRSTTQGVELQLRYQASDKTLIAAQYAYSSLTGSFPGAFEPVINVTMDRYAPANTASVLLSHDFEYGISASTTLHYRDLVIWKSSGDVIDSDYRVDAQLSYQLPFGGPGSRISLVAQNIGSTSADFHQNNRYETGYYLKFELKIP